MAKNEIKSRATSLRRVAVTNTQSKSKPKNVDTPPKKAPAAKPVSTQAPADPKFQPAVPVVNVLSLSDVQKSKTAWAPDIAALLSKYGATDALKFSRPVERILVQASAVDQLFKTAYNSDAGLFQGLVDKDARRWVFMLEGLVKLYGKELGHKGEALLTNVKALEDNLGNISLHTELLDVAQKAKLPGPVIDELNARKDQQRRDTENLVLAQGKPDAKGRSALIEEVVKTLVDHQGDFRDYEGDRKHTLERLAKHMRHMAEDPYDMTQPASGIHELRRDIRWVPVDVEALNGLIQLSPDKNPIAAYQPMLDSDLGKSKFVNLPAATREPEVVQVSKSLYTKMMDAVLKLGAIKDSYEPLALLADLYVEMGIAPNVRAARDQLDPLLDPAHTERDYQNEARVVYDDIKKNDLFGAMAKEYEDAAAAPAVADW